MSGLHALQIAATFVWFGAVFAISFIEAPVKFLAEGLTVEVGVNIGRLVFRALHMFELILVGLLLLLQIGLQSTFLTSTGILLVLTAILLTQVLYLRPTLHRQAVQEGLTQGISRRKAHHWYIITEVLKLAGLVWFGVLLFAQL